VFCIPDLIGNHSYSLIFILKNPVTQKLPCWIRSVGYSAQDPNSRQWQLSGTRGGKKLTDETNCTCWKIFI